MSSCGQRRIEVDLDPAVEKNRQVGEAIYGSHFRNEDQVCFTVTWQESRVDDGSSIERLNERFFFVENRCVGREQDTDGDGFFETLILSFPRKETTPLMGDDPFEVFIRNHDGSVSIGDNNIRRKFIERMEDSVSRAKQLERQLFGGEN